MRFSDWQLSRLRNALRAYHHHERGSDGEYFNWKDVSEAIGLSTEVEVPPERLRQFVEGNRSKGGALREFRSMKQESLEAIVKFVTEENLLLPAELEEHTPSSQAGQRLLEYLDQSFDRVRLLPPVTFEGTYQARRADERSFVVLELTLQRPSDEGMMQVTKTEERYSARVKDEYDGWTPEQRREWRRSRTLYGGWAIFTPEDNVMVFLKEADNGKNLYQFTLAADMSYMPGSAVERLVFLRHDYPIELENTNREEPDLLRSILEETEQNILIFRRMV